VQVQGPTSLALLDEVADESLAGIGFMRFENRTIAGAEVRVLRQGMAGELGYELHGDIADAVAVWNAIVEHGEPHGLERQGARARMINHVEASFPTPVSTSSRPGRMPATSSSARRCPSRSSGPS
jgi:glycine cleavage system aminomethyltransferase T